MKTAVLKKIAGRLARLQDPTAETAIKRRLIRCGEAASPANVQKVLSHLAEASKPSKKTQPKA